MTNPNTNLGTTVETRAFQALPGHPLPAEIAADNPLANANTPGAPSSLAPPGTLDISALRLGQDFGATLGVKKIFTSIPVRRPDKQTFVRVRPGEGWRLTTPLLEYGVPTSDSYLIAPQLWSDLSAEIRPVSLCTAITRQGTLFLWPLKLPGPDGRSNDWNDSAMAAAQHCQEAWCRVTSNRELGAYEIQQALAPLPEPEWPDLSFQQILDIAFRGRFIDNPDHPVIRQLRGLA